MEALGGDNAWFDRFVAQHAAIVYYWVVVVLYALSPKHAYQFSELVEGHATDTYVGVTLSFDGLDGTVTTCRGRHGLCPIALLLLPTCPAGI